MKHLLMKNVCDTCIASLAWWLVGHAFAFGNDSAFIGNPTHRETGLDGKDLDGEVGGHSLARWLQQLMYAVAAVTIVSGAVAERIQLPSYAACCFVTSMLTYPTITHWVWSRTGWLSVSNPDSFLGGAVDFAGGGVVHLTGGMTALIASAVLGPREGRFNPLTGAATAMTAGTSSVLTVLGTFNLWQGWLAFNMGSAALTSEGGVHAATRAGVTTTLAAVTGGSTVALIVRWRAKRWSVRATCNGILTGLVSITSGCGVVEAWASIPIGVLGGALYVATSHVVLTKLKVDDAIDAFAVHGAGGFWSLVSAGLFSCGTSCRAPSASFYPEGAFYGGGRAFAASLVCAVVICCWAGSISTLLFQAMNRLHILRVDPETEFAGTDALHYGGVELSKDVTSATVPRRPPAYTPRLAPVDPPAASPAAEELGVAGSGAHGAGVQGTGAHCRHNASARSAAGTADGRLTPTGADRPPSPSPFEEPLDENI